VTRPPTKRLVYYSEGDEANDKVIEKAASSLDKKRQNKTTDTAASFVLVKATDRSSNKAASSLEGEGASLSK
jgi:hypothetical protein